MRGPSWRLSHFSYGWRLAALHFLPKGCLDGLSRNPSLPHARLSKQRGASPWKTEAMLGIEHWVQIAVAAVLVAINVFYASPLVRGF